MVRIWGHVTEKRMLGYGECGEYGTLGQGSHTWGKYFEKSIRRDG